MLHIFDRLNSPSHILLLEGRAARITELEYAQAKEIVSKYQDRDITQHIRYNSMLGRTMQQIGLIGEKDRGSDLELKYQPTTEVKDDDEILIVDCVRVYKAEIVTDGVSLKDLKPVADLLGFGDEHKTVESLVSDSVIMIQELIVQTVAQKSKIDKLQAENENYLTQLAATTKKLGSIEEDNTSVNRVYDKQVGQMAEIFRRLGVVHIDQIKDVTIKKPRKPRVVKQKEVRADII